MRKPFGAWAAIALLAAACEGSPAATAPAETVSTETAGQRAAPAPSASGVAKTDIVTGSRSPDAAAGGLFGRYEYEFSGGESAGGTPVTVTYSLTLTPNSCRLDATGFQTDETILCTAVAIPTGLDVRYKSYGDGGLTDRYGNAVYAVGDPLFSLERSGPRVVTRWKGYPLPDDAPHRPGTYFVRAD